MLNKPLDLKFVNIIYLRPKKQPNFSTAVFPRLTEIYIEVRVPLFVTLSDVNTYRYFSIKATYRTEKAP